MTSPEFTAPDAPLMVVVTAITIPAGNEIPSGDQDFDQPDSGSIGYVR
jgi:hypothetical protein